MGANAALAEGRGGGRIDANDAVERKVETLVVYVGLAFGLPSSQLRIATRGEARIAFARQVAMYLAHTRLRLPFSDVGSLFGRDRTTAAHACRTIEEYRDDRRIDALIDGLERVIDLMVLRDAGGE